MQLGILLSLYSVGRTLLLYSVERIDQGNCGWEQVCGFYSRKTY